MTRSTSSSQASGLASGAAGARMSPEILHPVGDHREVDQVAGARRVLRRGAMEFEKSAGLLGDLMGHCEGAQLRQLVHLCHPGEASPCPNRICRDPVVGDTEVDTEGDPGAPTDQGVHTERQRPVVVPVSLGRHGGQLEREEVVQIDREATFQRGHGLGQRVPTRAVSDVHVIGRAARIQA